MKADEIAWETKRPRFVLVEKAGVIAWETKRPRFVLVEKADEIAWETKRPRFVLVEKANEIAWETKRPRFVLIEKADEIAWETKRPRFVLVEKGELAWPNVREPEARVTCDGMAVSVFVQRGRNEVVSSPKQSRWCIRARGSASLFWVIIHPSLFHTR